MCCPRTIVTALTYHTDNIFDSKRSVKHIREGRGIQTKLAEELCQRVGEYNKEGFTLQDIKNAEELLDVQIKVLCAENFNILIYSGDEKPTKIYLYKNGNHFDVINSMKAFFGSCYYCEKCDKPYKNKNKHKCNTARNGVCKLCERPSHSPGEKSKIYCENYNRYCLNQNCFDIHKSVFEEICKCKRCNKIKLRAEMHLCGYTRCNNCEKIVEENTRKCYMRPSKPKPINLEKYIFDYEADQETGLHNPNLVVAQYLDGTTFHFRTNKDFCK